MNQADDSVVTKGRFRGALRESPPLLWAFLYFFCLLSGYYVLRPVREAMGASADVQAVFPEWMIEFFARHGVSMGEFTLQVLFTCTFFIMLVLQPAYGLLVSRYPRRVFLPVVYVFFGFVQNPVGSQSSSPLSERSTKVGMWGPYST